MTATGDLADRVAIVTGGAQGIGAAIAAGLAAAGATVVIGDLQEPDTLARDQTRHDPVRSGPVKWHWLDVSDEESCAAIVVDTVANHGRLDIVVNNAGIMFETHLAEQDRASWDRMIAINLTGPMMMSKHAAAHLGEHGVGSIVNISSLEGTVCNPDHAAYSATKAGVDGLTRATAIDLGPRGIRCNAIAPGWIDTPLNASYVDTHPDPDLVIAELAKLHPVGRIGDTSDVASVAVWLAGDGARFVTGQTITVDGGRTARPPLPGILQ